MSMIDDAADETKDAIKEARERAEREQAGRAERANRAEQAEEADGSEAADQAYGDERETSGDVPVDNLE